MLKAYTAWGDSLTAGGEGWVDRGAYPTDLQNLLAAPVPVLNEGSSGQTSTQIGVREGAIPASVTIVGGTIPTTGPIQVTFDPAVQPVTNPTQTLQGTVQGVYGTLTEDYSDTLTFTRASSGSAVSVPGPVPFAVDVTEMTGAGFVPIFWEGRNDPRNDSSDLQATVDNITRQVATAQTSQYLVMSVINGDFPGERMGESGYPAFLTLDNMLANTFPGHYLDIRKILVSSYDPSNAIDLSDYQNDIPPTSLRSIQAAGTLAAPVGPNDTTMTVSITSGYPCSGCNMTIGSGMSAENTRILSISGSTVTVQRDIGGKGGAHNAGEPVAQVEYLHLNGKGYQVVANAVLAWINQQK